MEFVFEERPSESSFVDAIWRTQSDQAGAFVSRAVTQWEMVVACFHGQTVVTVRGPETQARLAGCPADAEFFGIRFKVGAYMPQLPVGKLANVELNLPDASRDSFRLNGSVWELPSYDNADTFIGRMVRQGMLAQDPIVDTVRQGRLQDISLRTAQRRFQLATGMTYGTLVQIERAERAAALLSHGVSILDTVEQAGYADQPHLTRSLKRFYGQTPGELAQAVADGG